MRCTTASIGLSGIGIEIDARCLPDFHLADIAFRNETAQVDLAQIEQRDDGRSGLDHFAGLGGARHDGSIERRGNDQIVSVFFSLLQLEARLCRAGQSIFDIALLLRDLLAYGRRSETRECRGWRGLPAPW